jgi:hypothetical protein
MTLCTHSAPRTPALCWAFMLAGLASATDPSNNLGN